MKIGFVGLGKMGLNMVERLLRSGEEAVVFDINQASRNIAQEKGAVAANSLKELVDKLEAPRLMWIMVPAGKPTEDTVSQMKDLLKEGDIIIDGGNSYYRDSLRRAEQLKEKGLFFLDAGTSGGIWGLKMGYCLMVGGEKAAFERAEPIFKILAPEQGYLYVGRSGAGHFVKMVHNGIEYALLQAYAEGFEVMEAKEEFNLNLARIAHLWNRGSVIRSWLLELTEDAFNREPALSSIKGYVEDSGEGRWTVAEAINENVPAPIITLSLLERFRSRQKESFSAKVIAALRQEFGGHTVQKTEDR